MGIGTSLGAFHEDDFAHIASPWMEKPEDTPDNNVIDPEVDPKSTQPITNLVVPISDIHTNTGVTITDEDIDKAMGIALSFSGGGLTTGKFPKGYFEAVPLEQRLMRSSTEPSHPGFRWDVIDKHTGEVVRKDVMTSVGARRSVDNMDNKYGGYKYRAEPRKIEDSKYTQSEREFIEKNKIDFNE